MASKAWISSTAFYEIMKQAAKNNGRAVVETTGSFAFEIMVDPKFAKEQWGEWEAHCAKFGRAAD